METEKIPCIKVTQKEWDYIIPYLKSWGYTPVISAGQKLDDFPLLVINPDGYLGHYINLYTYCDLDYNRILITNIEEFLEKAAALKGFIYKRKNIMEINGIEIKPGMVIVTEDNINYVAFPINNNMAFANITRGSWRWSIPKNIIRIHDLAVNNFIISGDILWEKPKEVVITIQEIADKLGIPVEQLRIKK